MIQIKLNFNKFISARTFVTNVDDYMTKMLC